MNETSLDAHDYLKSLRVTDEEPTEVSELDGAALWRITDDHFVLLTCADHEHTHRGARLLLRVMPAEWACFYEATNTDDGFEVYHYGPDMGE